MEPRSIADFRSIWCPTCDKALPMRVDIMPANKHNAYAAADLMCGACHTIVATLHDTNR